METQTTYTRARANLAKLCDQVTDNRDIVIIARRKGGDVALIAADELSSILETLHLLRSPKNADRLLSALKDAKARRGKPRSIRSLRREVGLDEKNKRKRTPERNAVFHRRFREDIKYWIQTDRAIALRAFDLIEAIMRDPFTGIGKPEPLRYDLSGAWSRRLTQEHRIVYEISDDRITFLQARYHY